MKKRDQQLTDFVGWGSGYIIQDHQISHLEGKLLTLIESMGLKDSQEKAVKDMVRTHVWELLSPCFVVSAEDHTALRLKYKEEGRGSGGSIPLNGR